VEGRARAEAELGRMDQASRRYRQFREQHATETALLETVHERLGTLALRLAGLPAFSATTLEGAPFDSQELRGKVVVVDFWATWCAPCLEAFPTLRKIEGRHGADVVLLGVSLDGKDDMEREALRDWVSRTKVPGKQLHDGRGWGSDLVRRFGVEEIPFTVVVGRDGTVLSVGERGKELERTVQTAVGALRAKH
jgi:thiol-disulfide isomerase/thioredoxin